MDWHRGLNDGIQRSAMGRTFLTAEWRKLIMAQYEVGLEKLLPYLPRGVELDLYQEKCYVSLVAFLFDRVRVKGIAFPFHTRFEEVNLRFYVRRKVPDGSFRRGVVFVREFVPRSAIATIAKRFYEEPYEAIPTRRRISSTVDSIEVGYDWRMGARRHSIAVSADPTGRDIKPGSVEEFITEHYWGYTRRRDGSTSEYEVRHPRWQTYSVQRFEIAVDMGVLYGDDFVFLTKERVASVLLAEGSPVTVLDGQRISRP